MTDIASLALLALIQGITEFLPVSSSAHLILASAFLPMDDQGLIIDVALHFGSLSAVIVSFRTECRECLAGGFEWMLGKRSERAMLARNVLVATIPLLLAGSIFYPIIATIARDPLIIAGATALFALMLWWADQRGKTGLCAAALHPRQALLVGLMQAIALIPGSSRTGMCLIGARLVGLSRPEALRFAMLLSIPAVGAATGLAILDLVREGNAAIGIQAAMAALLAAGSAFATIRILMRWIARIGFMPFIVYRLVLAFILLIQFA
ncbi:MAG: undecaprenyl-diphosphate phosphatase [Pseudomonadota bacterium]